MVNVRIYIVLIAILLGRQVVLAVGSSRQEEQGKNQKSCSHRLEIIKGTIYKGVNKDLRGL